MVGFFRTILSIDEIGITLIALYKYKSVGPLLGNSSDRVTCFIILSGLDDAIYCNVCLDLAKSIIEYQVFWHLQFIGLNYLYVGRPILKHSPLDGILIPVLL